MLQLTDQFSFFPWSIKIALHGFCLQGHFYNPAAPQGEDGLHCSSERRISLYKQEIHGTRKLLENSMEGLEDKVKEIFLSKKSKNLWENVQERELPVPTPKTGIRNTPLVINPWHQRQPLSFLSTHSPCASSSVLLSRSRLLSARCKATFSGRSQTQCTGLASAKWGWDALSSNCLTVKLIGLDLPPRPTSFIYFHENGDFWCCLTERHSLDQCSDKNNYYSDKLLHSR